MPVALVMGTSYLEDTTNLVKTEMTSQANHTLIACPSGLILTFGTLDFLQR